MKDEISGVLIKCFAKLKSKIFTIITEDKDKSKNKKTLIKTLLRMD